MITKMSVPVRIQSGVSIMNGSATSTANIPTPSKTRSSTSVPSTVVLLIPSLLPSAMLRTSSPARAGRTLFAMKPTRVVRNTVGNGTRLVVERTTFQR